MEQAQKHLLSGKPGGAGTRSAAAAAAAAAFPTDGKDVGQRHSQAGAEPLKRGALGCDRINNKRRALQRVW
eukprot:CAMPEP_0174365776 /NCGR_PEP_ID=MMETSP0811_2-20130205/78472_1 /TAXON_ID=73025 ORGANISM="Eutreptiella gymnastica-like, Strain CCMP1594" /NCGR_SAMPLE_ID=MMETSP0811_2 /ASSEMBLY_ACC=CAM_ASM_000667 /LENGTH=70 /DNA_ID=CAMNT_0015506703 /DNA_START=234 /DNA_END=443 /DNA_ORIENTATION=+